MRDTDFFADALVRAIDRAHDRVAPASARAAAEAVAKGRRRRFIRYLAGGVAAAGVIVSAVGGVVALSRDAEGGHRRGSVAAGSAEALTGYLVYSRNIDGEVDLFVYDVAGRAETRLTSSAGIETNPQWSPDGSAIVFQGYRAASGANDGIYVVDPGTGNVTLVAEGMQPTWAADGSKIVFVEGKDGGIAIMDADGSNVSALTDNPNDSTPKVSPDGSRIAFIRSGSLFVMDADGTGQVALTQAEQEAYPEWSPNGLKLAFTWQVDGNSDIYVIGSDGTDVTRLTEDAAHESQPVWAPDGSVIAYVKVVDGDGAVFTMSSDGTNESRLSAAAKSYSLPDWTPTRG